MDFGFTLSGGLDVQSRERLRLVVDTFGRNSCRSQGLSAVITDLYRLQTSDHKLYLAISQKAGRLTVFGGIKTGSKKLFIRVETGAFCEIEPVCVLDFYVNEDYQRQGLGKHLFEHCLAAERQTAASVGYDRPSSKLLAFLRKHYGRHYCLPRFYASSWPEQALHSKRFHTAHECIFTYTSVSQRPLTARQRPRIRTAGYGPAGPAYRHGVTSDTIPARRLSGTMVTQHSGASSVPAFRTAANQSQQSSQLVDPRHASHQRLPHQHDAAANASSSQSSLLLESAPQQGSSSLARQQSSGPVWQSSARNVCQDEDPESAGQKVCPQQADGQEAGRLMDPNQGYGRPRQTYSTAASSVMYVKPPWAFDDPYQTGNQMQSVQQNQSAERAAVASMPIPSWSSRVAAGQQRSGAGARECLRW
ncbi:MAG: alpha-tubulin N-acetyltransferase isoform X8 [Trebouxia sp. A1-2]|nr:MAG: alpha-tubulin N-acetyltransferase isoform X8 [Trebouxia sp. A1-2]